MAYEFEYLAGPLTLTEGPAWDGKGLFFTDINANRILRFDPATKTIATVYEGTNATNGLVLGPDGSLYGCEQRTGMIVRYDREGRRTVLASKYEGKRLNSPNDLALDSRGRIWFTDPRYGDQTGRELDHDSVYRITPPTSGAGEWAIERVVADTSKPNGLLLAPDQRTLYVAQSDYDLNQPRELRAYPVNDDGTVGLYTVLHDFGEHRGIDGMCLDTDGNILAATGWELGGPGSCVTVFSPAGEVLEAHPFPVKRPTNCTFGDADLRTLYVTSIEGYLYRTRTKRHGYLQSPRQRPWLPA
ncbi:MAG: SMP-30/gluconolactonase/LRE family protein [Thermomicrobiales bacterium]